MNKTLYCRIVVRSGDYTADPVLLLGEPGIEFDGNGKPHLKFGDGIKKWSELPYFMGDIEVALSGFMKASDYAGSKAGYVAAADTADKLTTSRTINGVAFNGTSNITVADSTKIPTSQKGVASGVATLDESGLVPASQLPSYVDDIIEGYLYTGKFYKEAAHTTLITGEAGKIYVDITSGADSKTNVYRWAGTAYVSISNPLDLATEAEATAGTDNTKAMTPLRAKQAMDAKGYQTVAGGNAAYEPKIATKGTAFNKDFGTAAGTVTEGNDARLSDTRVPKGTAGGDLSGSYPNPTIKSAAITDVKIADNSLNTSKLFVPVGDTLILNGGNS